MIISEIVIALQNDDKHEGIPLRSMSTRALADACGTSHQTAAKARRRAGLSNRYSYSLEATLTKAQTDMLCELATRMGLSLSEVTRQAIEFYHSHKIG